VIGPPRFG